MDTKISCRIPEAMNKRLEALLKRHGFTKSEFFRMAVRDLMTKLETEDKTKN